MILYLDTSSLIKLYVEENGTPEVNSLLEQASLVCTSVVAYPEARSALARLARAGALTPSEHEQTKADLDAEWPAYLALEVTRSTWRMAGELAERHGLRAFDSLHLSSFLQLLREDLGEPVVFSSFDDRLNAAAEKEGTINPTE